MKLELDDKWKWAAKDMDGEWSLYLGKPEKFDTLWDSDGRYISIDGIVGDLPSCNWQDSLHQIINGELVKHIELQVDDKVMVRGRAGLRWRKRYFMRFSDSGGIECFPDGATSWGNDLNKKGTGWYEWRLPTPEEL